MSEIEALGASVAALVEQIVERKLQERLASGALVASARSAPAPRPVQVPEAARLTGIGEDAIREWIGCRLIPRRLAGRGTDPKRATYVVTVEEVRAAAERRGAPVGEEPRPGGANRLRGPRRRNPAGPSRAKES